MPGMLPVNGAAWNETPAFLGWPAELQRVHAAMTEASTRLVNGLEVLLDEPEGGVDLEHAAVIGDAIASLLEPGATELDAAPAGLVVSHTGSILDRLPAHIGHLLVDGRLVHSGDAGELFDHIRRGGYRAPA